MLSAVALIWQKQFARLRQVSRIFASASPRVFAPSIEFRLIAWLIRRHSIVSCIFNPTRREEVYHCQYCFCFGHFVAIGFDDLGKYFNCVYFLFEDYWKYNSTIEVLGV